MLKSLVAENPGIGIFSFGTYNESEAIARVVRRDTPTWRDTNELGERSQSATGMQRVRQKKKKEKRQGILRAENLAVSSF